VSHVSSYKTEIRLQGIAEGKPAEEDPGWEILAQAVETVAEELDGRVETSIQDYFGRRAGCDFAVTCPRFPRGVGVRVSRDTGRVSYLFDDYGGYERAASEICDAITQAFVSLAVSRALETMNYEVEVEERQAGSRKEVLVRGVM